MCHDIHMYYQKNISTYLAGGLLSDSWHSFIDGIFEYIVIDGMICVPQSCRVYQVFTYSEENIKIKIIPQVDTGHNLIMILVTEIHLQYTKN